jgi:hypothetical protein
MRPSTAFLTDHQAHRLRKKDIADAAAEWLLGRIIGFGERLGRLLEASDGFELRQRDPALWTALTESNTLRNRLVHHVNEPVPILEARKAVTAVMWIIRTAPHLAKRSSRT